MGDVNRPGCLFSGADERDENTLEFSLLGDRRFWHLARLLSQPVQVVSGYGDLPRSRSNVLPPVLGITRSAVERSIDGDSHATSLPTRYTMADAVWYS